MAGVSTGPVLISYITLSVLILYLLDNIQHSFDFTLM